MYYLKKAIKIGQSHLASVPYFLFSALLSKPVAKEWLGGALNFLTFYNSQSFVVIAYYYTPNSQGN
jgi:hypothetical protein